MGTVKSNDDAKGDICEVQVRLSCLLPSRCTPLGLGFKGLRNSVVVGYGREQRVAIGGYM